VAAFCSASRSPLFEIASVIVCFKHVASSIVNAKVELTKPAPQMIASDQ
jgi:hypothetical protein